MAKKLLSSKANYVSKRMINELEVENKGKTTYIDGADLIDGMYVKKGVKFAKGSTVPSHDRMYNFLKDDLAELESSYSALDFASMDKFFSYWNTHLPSLKTKTNDRMYNFLKDDLKKLEKAMGDISDNSNDEEIDRFFSYWGTHLETLKMAKGGGLSNSKYIPNRMVQSVEVERKGKTTDIDGADILDGFRVKKGVKFGEGGNMEGWGGTSESSQDGMLIGGTNAELTSNQYGKGGDFQKLTLIPKIQELHKGELPETLKYNNLIKLSVSDLKKMYMDMGGNQYEHGGSMGGWCYSIGGL